MESKMKETESLLGKAEQLVKTSVELLRLKALDSIVNIVSGLLSNILFILIFCMFILSASIGIAVLLGDVFGKLYYGFFCVAGFYLLVGIILYFFVRKRMVKYFSDYFISKMI